MALVDKQLEEIIGYSLSDVQGARYYTIVDNVLYVDAFEGEPTIAGYTGPFKKGFNGKVNGLAYFNEIYLDAKHCRRLNEVEVTANWGSTTLNTELTELKDWLTGNPLVDSLDDIGVSSKKIEDFSVSLRTAAEQNQDRIDATLNTFGWYIRKPLIISVSSEQKDAGRYF